MEDPLKGANDALDRMRRAFQRGTGCRLTPEMLKGLHLTFLSEVWEEARPNTKDQPHD